MNRQHAGIATILAAATAALIGGMAAPAAAHVTVNPSEAPQGGFAALVFRVPNERDDASTVSLAVRFPTDQPIPFVSVKPHPGWSYEITRAALPAPVDVEGTQITEAVSTITWTAAAGMSIKPGEFDEFAVSVGPLPDAPVLVFPAVQTYSDGEVVRWIDPPTTGSEESENPAPVLALIPAGPQPPPPAPPATGSPTAAPTGPAVPPTVPPTSAGESGTDPAARWLAGIALVVGLGAGLLAGLSRRRTS
ncbi:MAG: YcnI family protein [Sporichthyaceae bacterium]|nr:YcnI family protein [Sporichthyaceae bacterium]